MQRTKGRRLPLWRDRRCGLDLKNARSARRAYVGIAASLALAAVISGCGGSASKGGTSTSNAGNVSVSNATIAINQRVLTLDPDRSLSFPSLDTLHLIGGTLMATGPDGRTPEPSLAQSVTVSSDRKTYTFTLRAGLKFSNGASLTSRDVIGTLRRSLSDKANVFGPFLSAIGAVDAPNRLTVVIHLKQPYTYLTSLLSLPLYDIFPAADIARGASYFDASALPVSAGPYKLASFTPSRVTFTINPNYAGPAPLIRSLTLEAIEDPSTRLSLLKAGQIQWADSLPPDALSQLIGNIHPVAVNEFRAVDLYMNDRTGPLANVNVRNAISLAINRKQINALAWMGKAIPMHGFLPPTMSDHVDNVDITPDLSKARKLLAGTPCASGCSLPILVTSGFSTYQQIATVIQQQLKAIGIQAPVQLVDPAISQQDELSGKYSLAIGDELSFTDAPDTQFMLGLNSNVIDSEFSGYKSTQMDQAITEFLSGTDAQRQTLNETINELYAKNLPFLTLTTYADTAGSSLSNSVLSEAPNTLFYVGTKK